MTIHSNYEEVQQVIEAACELLIAQRERYGLLPEMIYNLELNSKNGKRYHISIEEMEELKNE